MRSASGPLSAPSPNSSPPLSAETAATSVRLALNSASMAGKNGPKE